jgi:uncharacterized protein (DUF885 family)
MRPFKIDSCTGLLSAKFSGGIAFKDQKRYEYVIKAAVAAPAALARINTAEVVATAAEASTATAAAKALIRARAATAAGAAKALIRANAAAAAEDDGNGGLGEGSGARALRLLCCVGARPTLHLQRAGPWPRWW